MFAQASSGQSLSSPPATTLTPLQIKQLRELSARYPAMQQQIDQVATQSTGSASKSEIGSVVKTLFSVLPRITDMERHLSELDRELDQDALSRQQRHEILQSPVLSGYYQALRKLSYYILAAQVIMSGYVNQAGDSLMKAVSQGAQLIPGVGALVSIIEQCVSFGRGVSKHQALCRLAQHNTW